METTGIDFVVEICSLMQRYGLTTTQAQFSVQMLGKRPSYLSSMRARNLVPSHGVINELSVRVSQRIALFEQNPHLGAPYAAVLNATYQRLKTIQNMVESQLDSGVQPDVQSMHRLRDGFGSTGPTPPISSIRASIDYMLKRDRSTPIKGSVR